MTEPWAYPVAQAMQRHTGCRFVKPKAAPPSAPEEAPQQTPPVPAQSLAEDDIEPLAET